MRMPVIETRRCEKSLLLRFWSRVKLPENRDECWIWVGSKSEDGYGRLVTKGQNTKAHRLSWWLFCGDIPAGLLVCHHCDNPLCVRYGHLFLGTVKDNALDAKAKGRIAVGDRTGSRKYPERRPRGMRNGMYTHPETRPAKLTASEVLDIRRKYKPYKYTTTQLAAEYGVGHTAIHKIVTRCRWRDLEAGLEASRQDVFTPNDELTDDIQTISR